MKKSLLLILLLFTAAGMCQVKLVNKDFYDLKDKVFILRERKTLNAHDAFGLLRLGKFELANIHDNRINEGYVFTDIWLAIIKNVTNMSLQIEAGLQNGSVYKLHTYFFDDSSKTCVDSFVVSKFYPCNQRPIDSRHLYFPVTVPPQGRYTVLFKIDVRGNNFQFPLAIVL